MLSCDPQHQIAKTPTKLRSECERALAWNAGRMDCCEAVPVKRQSRPRQHRNGHGAYHGLIRVIEGICAAEPTTGSWCRTAPAAEQASEQYVGRLYSLPVPLESKFQNGASATGKAEAQWALSRCQEPVHQNQ